MLCYGSPIDDEFRAQLVEFERNYEQAIIQNDELQQRVEKSESYVQKLESRIRSLERRMEENSRNYKESEKQKRELEAMVCIRYPPPPCISNSLILCQLFSSCVVQEFWCENNDLISRIVLS